MTATPVGAQAATYGPETEWEARARAARDAFPEHFGDGWLTSAARDAIRIAAFAGFDPREVITRVARTSDPDRITNAATVDRVLGQMQAEWDAAHPEHAPA